MRALPLLVLALALAAPAAHAQQGGVRAVDRLQQGDTLVLVLHLQGQPAAHVSEPFHLADRVRLYLDLNETGTAPDSAALAALQGENLIALARRERTGGLAFTIDLRQLADYRVIRTDSTLQLRVLAALPATVAAVAPVEVAAAAAPPQSALARYADFPAPVWLLGAAPAALLLLAFRRRRAPAAAVATRPAAPAQPAAASPAAATVRADGRLWAVRTLAASGASTTDLVRRTGVPREAIRFLEGEPAAVSAGSGSHYRPAVPTGPAGARAQER